MGPLDTGPRTRLIEHVGDRPGHDFRYALDSSLAEAELGFRRRFDFETGLAKTVKWYLENEAWWRPIREGSFAGFYREHYG